MVKQNKRPGNTKHKYDQQRAAGKQSPRTGELTEHVVNTYTQVYYEHSGVRLRLGVTVPPCQVVRSWVLPFYYVLYCPSLSLPLFLPLLLHLILHLLIHCFLLVLLILLLVEQ